MSLDEEIVKIVIDRFSIGVLLLIAGYIANRSIERFKSGESLKNEFAKQRFAARLQRLERQLSEFYWPTYLRLQKDNVVWRRLLDKSLPDENPLKKIGEGIETGFILPNHKELVNIIETKIHLARPDADLHRWLLEYIDHVAVYNAAFAAGIKELHDVARDLLPAWPEKLFTAIEATTRSLQAEHDDLLKKYQES